MTSYWLDRAHQSLASAASLAEKDAYSACSRAYYAMFYAARAALFAVGNQEAALGKTHRGLVAAFGKYIVVPGHLDAPVGRDLSLEANRRLIADYEPVTLSTEDAREAIERATRFIAAVDQAIGRLEHSSD